MQVKIIIGTIAFMLTMIILGFAALREPARLEHFAAAEQARSIESGASLYKANCVECHGVHAEAKDCRNAAGEQVACKGRPLNYRGLVCGPIAPRMTEREWGGSQFAFVESTLQTGRTANGMPTWGQEFGGPLQKNEIQHLTRYILNFASEDFCDVIPISFPWPGFSDANTDIAAGSFDTFLTSTEEALNEEQVQAYTDNEITLNLPVAYPGDAARGETLYNLDYGCAACHGTDITDASTNTSGPGPHLGGLGDRAGSTRDGYSAEDYIYESILAPGSYLTTDCPTADGVCANAMSGIFNESLANNPQDLADIITFLMEN
jgi:mono/diheme cytochrome c family protein